jgi:tetratricopeptide (TPR) repeat protein
MTSTPARASIELEAERIRELSKRGAHREALAAARALVNAAPGNREALYLIAANQRCLNRIHEALATLRRLEQEHPRFSLLYQERGHCFAALRDAPHAIEAFLRAVNLNPALAASWIMLEQLYRVVADTRSAAAAAEQVVALKSLPPEIVRAGSAFSDGAIDAAEEILRAYLARDAEHVEALRLLGRITHQRGALDEAEESLKAVLRLAPDYGAARLDHARILIDRQKYPQALQRIDDLLSVDPDNAIYLSLRAAACAGLGRHGQAVQMYRQMLVGAPESAELHVALGHSLRDLGRQPEAIECYRRAAALRPSFGDAYWSLANLKTYRFAADEIAHMRAEEAAPAVRPADRYHFCFALGKAYEDEKDYAESWRFYEHGNRLKRSESRYDPRIVETEAREQMEACTKEFFAARAAAEASGPVTIFIVGLPRSGSTLIEQILASHSQVEGTQELFDVQRIALEMRAARTAARDVRYPGALAELSPEDFRRLGERYIEQTRAYRGNKPFFIDKMPNNFRHIGLIHLMLPNATIIDARREPMACCFSNLKQLFASGQEFSYSVEDIARYYCTYLELMRHWDAVLPGRVLRVCYEDVVEDLEANVRSILEFCGLEYEAGCVEFYKTERSVHTASSQQVRQPIFRTSLFEWRNYEPWLGRLKLALGEAVARYRE